MSSNRDKDAAIVVLSTVLPNKEDVIVKCMRIGRLNEANPRPRPLKFILNDDNHVIHCIRNAKKLKTVGHLKYISVSFDRTSR